MDTNVLKVIMDYPDFYVDVIRNGYTSVEEYEKHLLDSGIKTGSKERRVGLVKGKAPFISSEGDRIIFDRKAATEFLGEFAEYFGLEWGNLKEISRTERNKDKRISDLESITQEQDAIIANLRSRVRELEASELKTELGRKVLVASSIEVGPKTKKNEGVFLDDPQNLLDVEKLVSVYGGKLDSFYEEIPTDEEVLMPQELKKRYEPGWADQYVSKYEPGKELTLDNYRSRIMKRLGTMRFFEKRLKDVETAKKYEKEHGQIFPDNIELMYNPEDNSTPRKQARNKILENRFETLNRILQSDEFTNQEKLMLFAINGNFQYRNMEKYLRYASKYCINANFLIYLLQGANPNVCDTYINMVNFLQQFLDPSEFRMKLDLARELIEGKWYIMAEYNGKKTKFQLVPIDEFNELREKAGLEPSKFGYKGMAASGDESSDITGEASVHNKKVVDDDSIDIPDDDFELEENDEAPF